MSMPGILLAAAAAFVDPSSRLITDELADGHDYAVASLCLYAMLSGDSVSALADYTGRHRLKRAQREKLTRDCSIVAWVLIQEDRLRRKR
ncbi:hypothetical protein [Sphingomonas solaris]|uniref:Uncharacterized protein n=1 Tax=Alterirhizorhabdus solaris TaxID=2529389 RepID=A0A558QRT9_9SPHN|nr:hypothetical protein [Sphingomonas solaris]TVV69829.1 hypothetical protein FOY91_20690 [Sphingomonas solaris]